MDYSLVLSLIGTRIITTIFATRIHGILLRTKYLSIFLIVAEVPFFRLLILAHCNAFKPLTVVSKHHVLLVVDELVTSSVHAVVTPGALVLSAVLHVQYS